MCPNVFFCLTHYNCIIILLSVTVFVCHANGIIYIFLYNKFTSLSKKKQRVQFDASVSDINGLLCGVPYGSIDGSMECACNCSAWCDL